MKTGTDRETRPALTALSRRLNKLHHFEILIGLRALLEPCFYISGRALVLASVGNDFFRFMIQKSIESPHFSLRAWVVGEI